MRLTDLLSDVFNVAVNLLRPGVGSFNELIFEVNHDHVLTYEGYKRESRGRYATHDLVGRTSLLERLGREPDSISFEMTFHRALGIEPAQEVSLLRRLCHDGVADYLILGNRVCGENLWVIESVTEEVLATDAFGKVRVARAKVTLKEYLK